MSMSMGPPEDMLNMGHGTLISASSEVSLMTTTLGDDENDEDTKKGEAVIVVTYGDSTCACLTLQARRGPQTGCGHCARIDLGSLVVMDRR